MDEGRLNQDEIPSLIPGIYNYCDRWCEQCKKRQCCISYVMGKKIEEKTRLNRSVREGSGEKSLWSRLRHTFELTSEVLRELAEERGMTVDDIYASEQLDKHFLGGSSVALDKNDELYARIESCDILKICKIYEYWGECCINRFAEWMEQEEYECSEKVEIVTWYLDLIQSKMRKAMHIKALLEMGKCEEEKEYNGLVKVSLISIDRSITAWKKIHSIYPDYRKEIEHLLVMLNQLLMDIERQFPIARQFVRPGFDDE